MKYTAFILSTIAIFSCPLFATNNVQLEQEIKQLKHQAASLEARLNHIQSHKVQYKSVPPKPKQHVTVMEHVKHTGENFHSSALSVHTVPLHGEPERYYPTALIADERVVAYIAGTPVVSSPYLGARPAFDGSDYIVNISSINRDIRLMEQRRRLYHAYESIGYPVPHMPIIALSGKVEPIGAIDRPYVGQPTGDLSLGSSELDISATLNENVESFIGIAYDQLPIPYNGSRARGSFFSLNMGFINVGNLEKSPYYFTAGQLYAPFGRYSSSMISATLPMRLTRTRTRPFILGYKSQADSGPFVSLYAFRADTTEGQSGVGGVNLGYTIKAGEVIGEIGASYISSVDDATGMQYTGSALNTTFGGFGSRTNGNENVRKIPAAGAHISLSLDRYSLIGEWVGATRSFNPEDLSFNGSGALPQAGQLEAGVTFILFEKPASVAAGYQWSRESLALNLPAQRINAVFNISIWKDTVESLEYRHEIDYKSSQFANGAAPPGETNLNTIGTSRSADALLAQIGVFF